MLFDVSTRIKRKRYNTNTATLIFEVSEADKDCPCAFYRVALYKKSNGEFFGVYQSSSMEGSEFLCSTTVVPVTIIQAIKWAWHYMEYEDFVSVFGEIEDEVEDEDDH